MAYVMNDYEVAKILETLKEHTDRLNKIEKILGANRQDTIDNQDSIRTFLIEKGPKSDVDKVLVVGYYLDRVEQRPGFNVEDIENGIREAKEIAPRNTNLALIGNVKRGLMMENKEKKDGMKTWTLTNDGVGFVENGLKKSIG